MCAAGLALRCHLHTCAALRGSFWKLKCDGPSPLSCSLCDSVPGSECGNITGRACSSDISNPEHLSRPPPQLCGQHPSLRNPRALLSPFPSPFHAGIALGVWTTGNASSSSILPARLPRRKQMLTKANQWPKAPQLVCGRVRIGTQDSLAHKPCLLYTLRQEQGKSMAPLALRTSPWH